MAITDPIILKYDEKRDVYFLQRGKETFYTEARYMRTFLTPEDAIQWCEDTFDETPVVEGSGELGG